MHRADHYQTLCRIVGEPKARDLSNIALALAMSTAQEYKVSPSSIEYALLSERCWNVILLRYISDIYGSRPKNT